MNSIQMVEIQGNGGLLDSTVDLQFMPGFNLEGFPNRDSSIYTQLYGINDAHTCLRGTIRYKVRLCHLSCRLAMSSLTGNTIILPSQRQRGVLC